MEVTLMPRFANKDMVFFGVLALLIILAWAWMKQHPANPIQNTPSPLPSGLNTNGNITNGMDVRQRVNFQQQPYG